MKNQNSLPVTSLGTLNVNFKKLVKHARTPSYAKLGDAGLDLYAIDCAEDEYGRYIEYGTGVAVEIPKGYLGLLFPRSSISKTSHTLANSVGIIDSGYRGEIIFRFRFNPDTPNLQYEVNEKIGQLVIMPYPSITLTEVEALSDSERGATGFGSSDE